MDKGTKWPGKGSYNETFSKLRGNEREATPRRKPENRERIMKRQEPENYGKSEKLRQDEGAATPRKRASCRKKATRSEK